MIFSPEQEIVDRVYNMIQAGDLEGLKKLTKNMESSDIASMTKAGSKSVLVYAIQYERRDIIRWLV